MNDDGDCDDDRENVNANDGSVNATVNDDVASVLSDCVVETSNVNANGVTSNESVLRAVLRLRGRFERL